MAASPAERRTLASAAANERWSRTDDRRGATAPARKAFHDRFEKLVDPAGELTPDERARRAASARRAYMQRLAVRSARTRRAAADARHVAAESRRAAQALSRAASDLERLAEDTDAELGDLGEAASS